MGIEGDSSFPFPISTLVIPLLRVGSLEGDSSDLHLVYRHTVTMTGLQLLVKDGSAPREPARDIGGMRRKASGDLVGCAARHPKTWWGAPVRHPSVIGGATDCTSWFELAPHLKLLNGLSI